MLLIPIRGVGWGGNKCMRRVKVRRHNIMTKYFHVCFSINWFLCLVICSDVLLGSSVKSQGSVFLGKPEKLLLHRNLPINQESPCPTDFPGASLRQKQDKFAQCYQMWGPSWLTTMVAPGPNFWLLSTIWSHFDPGHLNRPEAYFCLRKDTEGRSQLWILWCALWFPSHLKPLISFDLCISFCFREEIIVHLLFPKWKWNHSQHNWFAQGPTGDS